VVGRDELILYFIVFFLHHPFLPPTHHNIIFSLFLFVFLEGMRPGQSPERRRNEGRGNGYNQIIQIIPVFWSRCSGRECVASPFQPILLSYGACQGLGGRIKPLKISFIFIDFISSFRPPMSLPSSGRE